MRKLNKPGMHFEIDKGKDEDSNKGQSADIKNDSLNDFLETENILRFIHESINDVVWQMNEELKFTYVSPSVKKITGYSPSEIIGSSLLQYMEQDSINLLVEVLKKRSGKGVSETPYYNEYKVKAKNGKRIYLEISSSPVFNKSNELIGYSGVSRDVTSRKKIEKALDESDERYRRLIMNMDELIAEIDSNGIFTFVNRRYSSILRYKFGELIGTKVVDLVREEQKKNFEEQLTEFFNKKKKSNALWEFKDKNGKYRVFECRGGVYSDDANLSRAIIVSNDVTERVNSEIAIKESHKRLIKAERAAGLGHWELDLKSGMIKGSEGALRIYGVDKSEITFKTIKTFALPEYRERLDEAMDGLIMEQKSYDLEFRIKKKKDKKIIDVHIVAEYDSREQKVFGVIHDITAMKRSELQLQEKNHEIAAQNEEYVSINDELQVRLEELRDFNIRLEEAKEKAEESDRLKSAFLANMSHEIRTPMNSILGFSELLAHKNLSEDKRQRFSGYIHQSGEQLMMLINDIIDISKIESNQLEITRKWCDVNAIMGDTIATHRQSPLFKQKESLSLEFKKCPTNEDLIVFSDPLRLRQIFDNLINNAIKFTSKGLIEIGYSIKENSGKEKEYIEFYISDTGVGIPDKSFSMIFKRFVQADNQGQQAGTGLGLSITKGLVELLGGRIWVESRYGQGSVFYFSHPMLKIEAGKSIKERKNTINSLASLKNRLIFIAEDDAHSYFLIHELLTDTGARLVHFKNGKELLRGVEKEIPDLIILDMNMPIMNGLEAVKQIRKKHSAIPIIAQTAYAMAEEKSACLAAGCDDYIAKPLKATELLRKLDKLMR